MVLQMQYLWSSKRSVGNLNAHHRRRHEAQMCGICGKVFELASTLTHHMYTHDERRFFCAKCSYHCHFESELKNIMLHITVNPPINVCAKTVDDGLSEKRISYSMWRHTERLQFLAKIVTLKQLCKNT